MAGRGNPSFLKNQKAQKRVAKANAKRAERQARRAEKAANRAEDLTPIEDLTSESAASGGSEETAES